jgi:cyanophycinase-like exopeptidase
MTNSSSDSLPGGPSGTLALVGAGEFLPSMRPVDEHLLAESGGRRVAILPTASAPDGPGVFERWAEMGEAHFRALGAQVEAVPARTRVDCLDPDVARRIAFADLVYFSGGKPDYLLAALAQTPAWEAALAVLQRGGVIAGCSAGAMILGAFVPGFRLRQLPAREALWMPALGLVPQAIVVPHFNEIPRAVVRTWMALRPSGTRAFGIDAGMALVGRPGAWRALGLGSVTVTDGDGERAYAAGDSFL